MKLQISFGERRRSIRAVESRVRSLAGDGDIGRRQPDSAVETTDFRISTRHTIHININKWQIFPRRLETSRNYLRFIA